jgi:hypothetical protein
MADHRVRKPAPSVRSHFVFFDMVNVDFAMASRKVQIA